MSDNITQFITQYGKEAPALDGYLKSLEHAQWLQGLSINLFWPVLLLGLVLIIFGIYSWRKKRNARCD